MASLNKVILIGHMTADPELKQTPSGLSVCSFSIGISRRYTKAGEQAQSDFINIVAWRQQAEFICNYFKKGQLIAIEGSIQTRRYQDKDGNNRTAFEVIANNVSFVGPKRDNEGSGYSAPAAEASAPQSFSNTDSGDFTEIASDDDQPF